MENTAKNFALQLGSLISLYVSIGALVGLFFGIITVLYPDPAQYAWEAESARMTIRTTIAILIVFFPTYIVLTRIVNTIRRTESGTYLTLTKWLVYLSLLVGGGVLLGDLVMVLQSFLGGELTTRFVLKALTVLLIVGGAFFYYLLDVRGYWQTHETDSIRYAAAVSLIVIFAVISGFLKIETPGEVREMNIDRTQVADLGQIQYQVQAYGITEGALPATLDEAFGGLPVPEAPEGREAYRYEVVSATNFKLCATFAYPTSEAERVKYPDIFVTEPMMVDNVYNWNHGEGEWCFERVVGQTPKN